MARIYVADDDADIRNLLVFSLIEEGHEVLAAKDGRFAMDAILQEVPDLLVLDVMMPNLDGFQVLAALDEAGIRSMVRVLILTARSSEKNRLEGLEKGADLYLTKPFDPDEFLTVVRDLLSSSEEELIARREAERDRASLLAQLDAAFTSAPRSSES
ncbi:MAG: response regulator transcription factor [Actinomycetota bacterium]